MHLLAAFAIAVTLSVPGRNNATPTVVADGTFVTVVWGATLPSGVTDIFAAVSRDGAHSFGPAVRVNQIEGDARVNGEQPPRAALVKRSGLDPSITVVWTTKGRAGTRLVMARSNDGGKTFSTATTVPESDAAGNRGWHNLLAAADGKLFAIWLDHREMADHAMGAAPQHAHAAGQGIPAIRRTHATGTRFRSGFHALRENVCLLPTKPVGGRPVRRPSPNP